MKPYMVFPDTISKETKEYFASIGVKTMVDLQEFLDKQNIEKAYFNSALYEKLPEIEQLISSKEMAKQ